MKKKLMKLLLNIVMIFVSCIFIGLAMVSFGHGSSAAFDGGVFSLFVAIGIWFFKPNLDEMN